MGCKPQFSRERVNLYMRQAIHTPMKTMKTTQPARVNEVFDYAYG